MAGNKVFVGSLPNDISEELLRLEFSKYGDVEEVFVKQGCELGRQWAMVKYGSHEQAQLAKESCDRILVFPGSDKPCDVMLAKNQGKGAGGAGAYGIPVAGGYAAVRYNSVATPATNQARKIFVGSLPDGIADETLRMEFLRYGTIEDIFIKPDCEPGRQWAFITYAYPEQAASAAEATNGILQFPGCYKACEVTLARHQGMFGQEPLLGQSAPMHSPGAPTPVASTPSRAPRKIFVGSLPDNITEAGLQAEFARYGTITDMVVKTGCEANRQWAFITFELPEQALQAKESCDKILVFPGADRPCEVTMARHQGKFGRESDDLWEFPNGAVQAQAGGYQAGYQYQAGAGAGAGYQAAAPAAAEGPKKVFVGSLPDSITEEALRAEFSQYGQIVEVFLKHGQESGRQWAFVTFTSSEEAAYAKESTDRVLMFPGQERACEVTLARNQGKFGQAPLANLSGGAAASGGAHPGPQVIAPPFADALQPQPQPQVQPPPPSTPPPPHLTPWRMYRTAAGLPYYHNVSTGVTQWECPPDFQIPGQALPHCAGAGSVQSGTAYGQPRYAPY